jgi:tetraacyldisaccharide 4'-kinase
MPHLLRPSQFRDLVSGRRRGFWAAVLRGGLAVAEVPYTWAVRRRNRRYDNGTAAIHRVAVPVISVGNLTLGGTGKTPMVQWLARWLADRQVAVGIVSRGYGAVGSKAPGLHPGDKGKLPPNDEALELAWNLPGVPHVQNPDRVAAARRAIAEFHCRLILLDDGFQHRRLARDLDLVLLDALEPFGYGHIFPRGTLREPLEGLARADVVALSRADLIGVDERTEIRRQVRQYAPRAEWIELTHRPERLVGFTQPQAALDSLAGQRVLAFCGIGNPAGFRHTLAACGYEVVGFLDFPDHHLYTRRDLERIAGVARQLDAAAIVCTQKDLVKVGGESLGKRPLWALRIGLEILAGREALETRLEPVVARAP